MEHRSVCIIGSGGGIGSQIVKLFRNKGYKPLIMMDLPSKEFDDISRGFESEKIEINLEENLSIKNAFEKAKKISNKLDVLIFTSGIVENKNLTNLMFEEWDRVLSINLTGLFKCMVEAENWLASNGRIVTMGSMAGHQGSFVTGPAYAASKGGRR